MPLSVVLVFSPAHLGNQGICIYNFPYGAFNFSLSILRLSRVVNIKIGFMDFLARGMRYRFNQLLHSPNALSACTWLPTYYPPAFIAVCVLLYTVLMRYVFHARKKLKPLL